MKQVSVFTSTYTADVSGVCSALYELGGMVVMHDPSGCNSTYNTHDEPRWYDNDSLIFISGLQEIDAIMGNDDKLIQDICDACEELKPAFVALSRTPIPLINGTDFDAIAKIITDRTGIPTFFFPTNGTFSYVYGAGLALETIADFYTPKAGNKMAPNPKGVNLLGVTPLDFSVNTTLASMREFLKEEGFELISCMAMDSSLEEISRANEASVNLVVSSVGLLAAKKLKEKFGTPYVVGMPTGSFGKVVAEDMRKAIETGVDQISILKRPDATGAKIAIVGEAVVSASLAAEMSMRDGVPVKVISTLELEDEILVEGDEKSGEEEELAELFKAVEVLIGDPLFKPIVPDHVQFKPLPHEAYSGRIYRTLIPDLVKKYPY